MENKKAENIPPIFDSASEYDSGEFVLLNDSLLSQIGNELARLVPTSQEYSLRIDSSRNLLIINFGENNSDSRLLELKENISDTLREKGIKFRVVFE